MTDDEDAHRRDVDELWEASGVVVVVAVVEEYSAGAATVVVVAVGWRSGTIIHRPHHSSLRHLPVSYPAVSRVPVPELVRLPVL